MKFLENKKNKISAAALTMLLQFITMGLLSIPAIPLAHAEYTCNLANPPGNGNNPSSPPNYILTILEENIGGPTSTTDTTGPGTNVLECYRVNTKTTATDSDGKTQEEINSIYASSCTPSDTVICQKVQLVFAQSGAQLIYVYASLIYRWAAVTVGIVAVFFIVLGGVEMQTSQGDSGRIEKAKERIMQSIGGLVLLFLSALILYTINPNFFTLS